METLNQIRELANKLFENLKHLATEKNVSPIMLDMINYQQEDFLRQLVETAKMVDNIEKYKE